jgi:hypothetical protein
MSTWHKNDSATGVFLRGDKYLGGRLRVARDFTTAQTELEKRIRELADRITIAEQAANAAVSTLAQARSDRRALDV